MAANGRFPGFQEKRPFLTPTEEETRMVGRWNGYDVRMQTCWITGQLRDTFNTTVGRLHSQGRAPGAFLAP